VERLRKRISVRRKETDKRGGGRISDKKNGRKGKQEGKKKK